MPPDSARPATARPKPPPAPSAKPASTAKPATAAKLPGRQAKPPAGKARTASKGAAAKMKDNQFESDGATAATFVVEVDGVEIGRFREVSGLQVEVQVEEFAEGGEHGFVHKLPGRLTWPNLTLKRGVTNDDNLLGWLQNAAGDGMVKRNGKANRTSAAVSLVGSNGRRLRTWSLTDALPVRWSGPSFASESTDLPEEELEIAHHGFRARTH
jgi:phage tail-like protein